MIPLTPPSLAIYSTVPIRKSNAGVIHKNQGDDAEGDGDMKKDGDGRRETETAIN